LYCVLYHYSSDYGNLTLEAETIYLGSVLLLRKNVVIPLIAAVSVISMSIGAVAASNLEEITVYLNKGVSVQMDGEKWTPKDETGNTLYPITYNGSTYLPVRAVGEASGLKVGWNEEKQKVLLGGANESSASTQSTNGSAQPAEETVIRKFAVPNKVKSIEKKGLVEENGTIVFYGYDKDGVYLGIKTDEDNIKAFIAKAQGLTPPPAVSEGWFDSEYLGQKYGRVDFEKKSIILMDYTTKEPTELYRFNMPDNYQEIENGDLKSDGIRIKVWNKEFYFNISDLQKLGLFQ
jgi:hypothetical protein